MKKSTKNLIIYVVVSTILGAINGAVQAHSSLGISLVLVLGSLCGVLTWLHYSWRTMEEQLEQKELKIHRSDNVKTYPTST